MADMIAMGTKGAILGLRLAKHMRTRRIIEQLENRGMDLEDALKSDSDLFRLHVFMNALDRASTDQKAEALKNLYVSFSDRANPGSDSDDLYFEIFSIIGELSDREIRLIYLIDVFARDRVKIVQATAEQDCDEEASDEVGPFYRFISDKLNVSPKIARALTKRLERTGLIETRNIDSNPLFQEYVPSELYSEIKDRIMYAIEDPYGK